ncbi:MAG: hypothetical protein ABFE01_02845 [Phycisphaerales bacterium]
MNGHPYRQNLDNRRAPRGIILLITLVILVILATLGYTLTVRVSARRHRDQYAIDYAVAKHACASGMRYALASLDKLDFALISRPNEPDFSDIFAMPETEYQKLLDQMELYLAKNRLSDPNLSDDGKAQKTTTPKKKKRVSHNEDVNDVNAVNDANDADPNEGLLGDRSNVQIPGPYGPPWPLVTEPVEFEIGTAKIKIEIEDENAKYPLGWAMLADDKFRESAGAGWTTFCEWMGYSSQEIADLNKDLVAIGGTKPFKMEFKAATAEVEVPANLRTRAARPTPGGAASSAAARRTVSKKPVSAEQQLQQQNKEFAKLFHSSMVNSGLLSRPSIESDSRQESALKYLGLWGTRQVNINTAPRHVLESALSFGSVLNAPKIAEAIIQQRKIKPVADVNEVKKAVLGYSDSIESCRNFLTATSTVFTIRITAVSGAAKVSALAAVSKEGDKIQPIAVISD